MKKVMFLLMALLLVAGTAMASKPALEKPIAPYHTNSRAVETEPNNDATTANAWDLSDLTGDINPGGDVDYFAVTVLAGDCMSFETHAGTAGDTKLYIYDVDGTTQLAYDDDGGQGYYSLIEFTFPADGTYFVTVTGYSSSTTGSYILTAVDCPEPPNCDAAIDIQIQSLAAWVVDLCAMPSQFSGAYGDCTGYSDAGNEALYKIYLLAGEQFTVTEDGSHDMSLYLVTDCADIIGSCVAGSDACCTGAQELIDYYAAADGWYYLIVDGYSGCSEVTVTVNAPVGGDETTWGSVKDLYR